MSDPSTESMSDRVEQLEHTCASLRLQVRLCQGIAVIACIIGSVCMFMLVNFNTSKPTQRNSYSIKDANGNIRSAWGIDEVTGRPALAFFDSRGKRTVSINEWDKSGAGVRVFDRNGTERLVLGVDKTGTAGLATYESHGNASASIGSTESAGSGLTFFASDHRVQCTMGVDKEGSPSIYTMDENGRTLYQIPPESVTAPG